MPKITIPKKFECPITQSLMLDPVITAVGQTYERKAIERWFEDNATDPLTGQRLPNKQLTKNYYFKCAFDDFIKENQVCSFTKFIDVIKQGSLEQLEQLNYLEYYLHLELEDKRGFALFAAIDANNITSVSWLLQQGADVNVIDSDVNKRTPLHYAALSDDSIDLINLFLQWKADVTAKTVELWTPLHIVAMYGNKEAANILLQYGASLDAIDSSGNTALHLAAFHDNQQMITFLLQQGASIKVKNNAEQTPLEAAGEELATFIRMEHQRLKQERANNINELKQLRSTMDEQIQQIAQLEQQRLSTAKQLEELKNQLEQLTLQSMLAQQQQLTNVATLETARLILQQEQDKEQQQTQATGNIAQNNEEANIQGQTSSIFSGRLFK